MFRLKWLLIQVFVSPSYLDYLDKLTVILPHKTANSYNYTSFGLNERTQICSGLNANEMHILYDKHHKVSSVLAYQSSSKHAWFWQTWSNIKMANNPVIYEALFKQKLPSILDISDQAGQSKAN